MVSNKIKEILKNKGISQEELAERMGITTVGLNKNINGNPTVKTLKKIADAIDCDISDFFEANSPILLYYNNIPKTFASFQELKDFINKKTED